MLRTQNLSHLSKVALVGLSLATMPLESAQAQSEDKLDLSRASFNSEHNTNYTRPGTGSETLNTIFILSAFVMALAGAYGVMSGISNYRRKALEDQEAIRRRRHDPREC